jgi:hypothetical protein
LGLFGNYSQAQDLLPRAYWPTPYQTQLLLLGLSYQSGDVLSDPALPIVGAESKSLLSSIGYQRTLNLWGRTANWQVSVPYVDGSTRASVGGIGARQEISGAGDLSTSLSINLLGAPSFSPEQFQAYRLDPKPILAAEVKVVAPTGQYQADRLVNIGSNRWAGRLRLGYIQPLHRRWLLEMSAGRWYYEDNDGFIRGTRQQDPVTVIGSSLIHRIRPGFWASIDAIHYRGGRTTVNGRANDDRQRNTRLGVALNYPFARRHLLRFSASSDVSVETGGDFTALTMSYAYRL